MWQKVLISALCVLAWNANLCHGKGYYTISASKVFRANSNYHISVTNHDGAVPAEIQVGVVGDQSSGNAYSNLRTITVDPDTTKIVDLDVGPVTAGEFNLTARGLTGFKFENNTQITLNEKSFSVLIQTDKAIYKPGDMVNFRVIVLDANLKPFPLAGDLSIFITDAKQNRVKRWKDGQRDVSKGVFTGDLQLSPTTVLGDWNIEVTYLETTHNKKFEVAEYVLPKFQVNIDTPPLTTFKDQNFRIIVRSTYTYGKPVKGEATISVFPKFYGSYQPFVSSLITRKVVKIDGKASVEFNIEDELGFKEDYQREITIEAVVEEELTGRKQNTTTSMTLYRTKYELEFTTKASKYKPGLPVEAEIKVHYHDGTPVTDKNNQVEIFETYKETYEYSATTMTPTPSRRVSLDSNGMAKITLNIPHNTSVIDVSAKYLDVTGYLGYLQKSESKSNSYISLIVNTQNPEINQEISATVTSTQNMKSLTYVVMGRGDIIIAKTVPLDSVTSYNFKFLASFAMVPRAKLVVYYVTEEGEIISESANIEFRSQFQNFLKIEMSKAKAKPGEDVSLTISTKPNSLVALLGVDQSVNLLKSGNDLNQDNIFQELESYETATQYGGPRPVFRRFAPWNYNNVWKDFDNSGMVLLTNAQEEENPRRYYALPLDAVAFAAPESAFAGPALPGPPPPGAGFGGGAVVAPPKIRKEFPESWIWESVEEFGRVYGLYGLANRGQEVMFSVSAAAGFAPGSSAGAMMPQLPQPPKIRKEFPETWIWDKFEDSGIDGTKTISKKVPDTITSWIITGFAVDPITGFGMTKMPRKLEVFQPFFVSLNLPYSIKRGEVVSIPIVCFNYMDTDITAEVTFDNTAQDFDFVDVAEEGSDSPKVELYRRKSIAIKSGGGSSLSFMIKPKKVGPITIKVTATSPLAGDGVERPLIVEPEGTTQYENKAVFVDLTGGAPFESTIELAVPKNAVPDSTKIEVAVVGDILGSTVKNLDKLIRMPYGCGEQNMLVMVPNIVVLNYLTKIDALPDTLKAKALKHMESGYQRELTYKHKDGSFSAFGESDKSGSTWLTAFVARSFRQAAKYIDIEESIITTCLDWLADKQAPNGSFPEVGQVSHKDMQGGAGEGIALTAYTLITFLENKNEVPKHQNTITKALEYIVRNLSDLDDVYALTLAAYALQLANHNNKDLAFQRMEAKATSDSAHKWWNKPVPESETKSPYYGKPNSVNVEMTAYALLTYLEAGNTNVFPILKWLIAQRNAEGGFTSTQDTVIGLTALAKMGERISSKGAKNMNIKVKYGEGVEKGLTVNNDNAMLYQSSELPTTVRQVNLTATGTGFAVVQISYRYNLNVTAAWPRFVVDPQVNKNSNADFLHLTVCTSYIPDSPAVNESNMALMEVAFPSGFTADLDTLPSLEAAEKVKRVETKNGDTVVVIYFDNLDRKERCPTLTAFRTFKVAHQKPAAVTVRDYYDTTKEARVFYEAPTASICDICEGSDCGTDKCTIRAEEQRSSAVPDNYFDKEGDVLAKSGSSRTAFLGFLISAVLARLLF